MLSLAGETFYSDEAIVRLIYIIDNSNAKDKVTISVTDHVKMTLGWEITIEHSASILQWLGSDT